MTDPGLSELLKRMKAVAESEGASRMTLTNMGDIAGLEESLAVLQFSHPEVERLARESPIDPSYVLPLAIKVKEEKGGISLEADRFYRIATDMDLPDDKKVRALLHEIDRLMDRIVGKL